MRNLHLLVLALASGLSPFATQAAPSDLPETEQTTCYDATGSVIACAGTGQDGMHRAGVAWPIPRFSVGTGALSDCVTDNLTGLMWVKAPSAVTATWANALTSANNLTLCGFSDWRMPNITELESLVNSEAADQAAFLNTQGFTGVSGGNYWSSSSDAVNESGAWVVSMHSGYAIPAGSNSISRYVWPVRAGQ